MWFFIEESFKTVDFAKLKKENVNVDEFIVSSYHDKLLKWHPEGLEMYLTPTCITLALCIFIGGLCFDYHVFKSSWAPFNRLRIHDDPDVTLVYESPFDHKIAHLFDFELYRYVKPKTLTAARQIEVDFFLKHQKSVNLSSMVEKGPAQIIAEAGEFALNQEPWYSLSHLSETFVFITYFLYYC